MENKKLKLLTYQNYLAMISNSPENKMFRNIFAVENKKKRDILKNGENSCAYFVSSVLKIFDLISTPHATVKGTVKDMMNNGWRITKQMIPGNVVLWEEIEASDGFHPHLGFVLGKDKAISNSHKKRMPIVHHLTYGNDKDGNPKRKVVKIFTHRICSSRK